jgi:hypothetical protein
MSIPVRKINQISINSVPDKFLSLLLEYISVYVHSLAVSGIVVALITNRINVSGYE